MRRVAMRGIAYEQLIDQEYLERLGEAYARFFYDFDEAPLLIVNAASIDPIIASRTTRSYCRRSCA